MTNIREIYSKFIPSWLEIFWLPHDTTHFCFCANCMKVFWNHVSITYWVDSVSDLPFKHGNNVFLSFIFSAAYDLSWFTFHIITHFVFFKKKIIANKRENVRVSYLSCKHYVQRMCMWLPEQCITTIKVHSHCGKANKVSDLTFRRFLNM